MGSNPKSSSRLLYPPGPVGGIFKKPRQPVFDDRRSSGDVVVQTITGRKMTMAQWHWSNQDKPPGLVIVAGPVGVTTVMDSPQAAQRPYAFVAGSDGNLWLNWWDGAQWHWSNQDKPPGLVIVAGPVGVTTV